jgi:hypothetical protein
MSGADRVGGSADGAWAQLVGAVRADLPECIEKTVESSRSLRSYDDVGIPVIREVMRHSYEAVLDGLDERRAPGPQDDGMVFETGGEKRARQGVVIREMLTLWRIGLENLYELAHRVAADSPERDALLLEFLELALAWDDFAMIHAAEGHRRGELNHARERQHAQTNFVRRVLSGIAAAAEIHAAVDGLGLDPHGLYHAVRARPLPTVDIAAIEQYLGANGLVRRGNGLLAVNDGDACGFVAALPGARAPVAVGRSDPARLSDMEPAFRQAGRALETALILGAKGVFGFDELSIYPAIATDPDVGGVMLARYVEPLEAVAGGATILTTVEHYLANDRGVDLTAKDLGVHANTVRQRLERFEQTTGQSLRETETLVELYWALEHRRIGRAV